MIKILLYYLKKKSYKNNKFKISAPKWTEEFELPDGLYSVSDIQDYFVHIIKKHRQLRIYIMIIIRISINKIENRIRFKIKQDIISNFYFLKQ